MRAAARIGLLTLAGVVALALLFRRDPDDRALDQAVKANEAWTSALLGIQKRRYDDSLGVIQDSLLATGIRDSIDSALADSLQGVADSTTRARENLVELLPASTPESCAPWGNALQAAVREAQARAAECRQKSKVIKGQRNRIQLAVTGMKLAAGRVDSLTPALARTDSLLKRAMGVLNRRNRLNLGLFTLPRPPRWLSGLVGCAAGALLVNKLSEHDEDLTLELQGCTSGGWAGDYIGR